VRTAIVHRIRGVRYTRYRPFLRLNSNSAPIPNAINGSGDETNFPNSPSVRSVTIADVATGFILTVDDGFVVAPDVTAALNTGGSNGCDGVTFGVNFNTGVVGLTGVPIEVGFDGVNIGAGRIRTGGGAGVAGRVCTVVKNEREVNPLFGDTMFAPRSLRYVMRRILRISNFELTTPTR
jgi:hypothetical protein